MSLQALLSRCDALRWRALLCGLLCGLLCVSPWVWGYGPRGHQTSATVAEQLLAGTAAEAQVRALLAPLGLSLREASVWADCVKAVRPQGEAFVYQQQGRHPECRVFEDARGRARAQAYVQANWSQCAPRAQGCHRRYHYTDVAIQRSHHALGQVGTSDHDLVAALRACILVLQGRPAPPPFRLADRAEALLLLTHLVGDVHQPLHVGAVYLHAQGRVLDPAVVGEHPAHDTVGGNRLMQGRDSLHALWDEVPARLAPAAVDAAWLALARGLPRTAGPLDQWPAAWADETLLVSRELLGGLRYGPLQHTDERRGGGDDGARRSEVWPVLSPDDPVARARWQQGQLIRAGARLAQVLQAVWP